MMVVVAIVAVLGVIAILNITQTRDKIGLDRNTMELRRRIEHARELASVAGSRTGPSGPPVIRERRGLTRSSPRTEIVTPRS